MKFYYTSTRAAYDAIQAPEKPSPWRSCVYADLEDGDLFVAIEFRDRREKVAWEGSEGVIPLPSLYASEPVPAPVKEKLNAHLDKAASKRKGLDLQLPALAAIAETDRTSDVLKKLAKHHGDFILPEEL